MRRVAKTSERSLLLDKSNQLTVTMLRLTQSKGHGPMGTQFVGNIAITVTCALAMRRC